MSNKKIIENMKNIIEDLGGIFDPEGDNSQDKNKLSPIEIYPPTYNRIPLEENQNWTIYLQFDNDTPIPFAFVPNGDEMRIKFLEPKNKSNGGPSPALIFTDVRTNKTLRLFAKK